VASDRIGQTSAKLVGVPPFEVVHTTTDFMLSQPQVAENIHNVPANEALIESVRTQGIVNPFLSMKMWYPLAGSQRLRAVQLIKEADPTFNLDITVHRFLEDWHNCFYLWPDEEFRSKAIAIWFQTQEVVFKSLYYEHDTDENGRRMTDYEEIGEELKWNRDNADVNNNSNSIVNNDIYEV
jgi:hypothetical protein|tara:strand:+ start:221 stop:763 length:543 start_codon:yes stop_codon:yes gene_type:complete